MSEPTASRPHMPGYGIVEATEGSRLLPWSWAEKRLSESHDYWLSTIRPDCRPHIMPVWGVWNESRLWFSSSLASRKARNLLNDPRCTIATDNALEPVVMEGTAERVTDLKLLARMLELENRKYSTNYGTEMLDLEANAWFRFRPRWAFGLMESDFTGSPTRWRFDP